MLEPGSHRRAGYSVVGLKRQNGFTGPLAYHDARWRRDKAPLLDHLGAVIDHVEPHTRGGVAEETNLVTACNKCNMRKNAAPAEDFTLKSPRHRVRGKYGEPEEWDGFSTLFVLLVETGARSRKSERTGVVAGVEGPSQRFRFAVIATATRPSTFIGSPA